MTEMSVLKRYPTDNTDDHAFGEDSIFAGLTVPSFEDRSKIPKADDNALTVLSLPSVPSHLPLRITPSAPPQEHDTAHISASKIKGSLQSLYATNIITADVGPVQYSGGTSLYPELPNITRRDRTWNLNVDNETGDETSSLLSNVTTTNVSHDTPAGAMSTTLVNELLHENSRLTEEVLQLRKLLNQSTKGETVNLNNNDISIRDSPQLPTNDTTVKYVCCGGCRQWLVAPKTALYVVCSRCDAVNNCNIPSAPAETLPSNTNSAQQLERHAQQRSDYPWFLECFRQFF